MGGHAVSPALGVAGAGAVPGSEGRGAHGMGGGVPAQELAVDAPGIVAVVDPGRCLPGGGVQGDDAAVPPVLGAPLHAKLPVFPHAKGVVAHQRAREAHLPALVQQEGGPQNPAAGEEPALAVVILTRP
jgi:hypothetical protein